MTRIDPPLPVRTPFGDGHAIFVIDRGTGFHLEWVCAIDATGELWTLRNPYVRRQTSLTEGWTDLSPFPTDTYEQFHWIAPEDREATHADPV